jgi:hypothetical protein
MPPPIDGTYTHAKAVTAAALDLRPRGVELIFPQS